MDTKLRTTVFYHIYNRGNNRENIFIEERNYSHFLRLYTEKVVPVVDTFAYCLLKNHFHLLIRVKDAPQGDSASQKFSNFYNAYTKAINQVYQRTGALFQHPFQRKAIESNRHYLALIAYIHFNPQKHGFIDDYREWPYSSYQALLAKSSTRLAREQVLKAYGGPEGFLDYHAKQDLATLENILSPEDLV